MKASYDLIVIGGGAAGFSAVTYAAEQGVRVALVTNGPLGGTCVNYGCVPSKYLLTTLALYKRIGKSVEWADIMEKAVEFSAGLRAEKYEQLLESLDVDLYRGNARFTGPHSIRVDDATLWFDKAIIAVGGRTVAPPVDGVDEVGRKLLDNELLFGGEVRELESVVVIGGRAQGVEVAQLLARAGVRVTLLQRSPRLLPSEEPEAGKYMAKVLEDDGVEVLTGVSLERFERGSNGSVSIRFTRRGEPMVREAEYVYLATGRRPKLQGMGLERVGVRVSKEGFIEVDSRLRAAPNIYAAGDCIGEPMLEPVAAREGYVAAVNALGGGLSMDYTVVPRAVFTDPEYATVGLTEAELARRIKACSCRVVDLSTVPKARILGRDYGFVKMVVDPRDKRVVGVHMLAPNASEAIHEAALAIRAGMTIDDIIDTIHVFPTVSEALKYAALAFYRNVYKMPCCLL